MIFFIEAYLADEKENDDTLLFNTNDVCILYFSNEDDDEYRKELIGTYPGDMNNFELISSSEFWLDPEETFSNVYLDKKISENKDYLIVTKDIYSTITKCFGVFNEIERKSIFNDENLEIEIHLKKVINFFLLIRLKSYS
jgi:hypothetical protein